MPYDRDKNHRRSIRLPDYDYTSPGAYFVTICAHQGELLFGKVVGEAVVLSEYGQIARDCWEAIPTHFAQVELDAWVVMPNHLHGILVVTESVGAQHAAPLPSKSPRTGVRSGSLGAMIRSFKSAATRRINQMRSTPGARIWLRNYYEHVIRNDASLKRIREYIQGNPARWSDDRLHPDASRNLFNQQAMQQQQSILDATWAPDKTERQ